ncbi:glycoside hydrolase family 16 protein [Saccharata proteae CBS 121410]|uniref:endo-1,3(4)-beta-glucanase n=1 Tax=Saccharata proteae CBS 121410 TaxID=1314787 RepID=A0A9P4M315_9PEZI|nr:glycoside hydrolase family 16 protein [Saccharata proteae CBS 121410]
MISVTIALALGSVVAALPASKNTTAGAVPFVGPVQYVENSGAEPDASTTYTLESSYDYTNWMSSFAVQALGTGDPTHGFVNYLSQSDAQSQGLYSIRGDQIYIGVDHSSTLSPSGTGRGSVRLQSNTAYTHGLFILDLAHMPGSVCGSWPAYWLVGPNWPYTGEIDIIEGVNANNENQMTLHTAAGCDVTIGEGGQTGTSGSNNCNDNNANNGCPVVSNTANTYGTNFNSAGGGVYATFWNQGSIQHWYWPESKVPSDIRNNAPTPLNWGTPQAHFGGCAFDNFITDNSIIFDITFCGDWAGNVWSSGACANDASTCQAYVAGNPGAFSESYWLVNSLKVYKVDS